MSKPVVAPLLGLLLLGLLGLLLLPTAQAFAPPLSHRPGRATGGGATAATVVDGSASASLWAAGGAAAVRVAPLFAVWSNPQETEDYIRRIEGKEPPEKTDQPSVIIGKGTLGKALAEWGGTGADVLLGRGDAIPDEIALPDGSATYSEFPIYVCVPEWEVESVILACPKERKADLVFMQTACLENLLKRYGLCNKQQTQCVPYFGVSAIGRPLEGRVQYDTSKSDGEPKYAGETAVCGKWRGAVAERLKRQGLSCLTLDYTYWRKHMLERLLFDSVFSIISTVHGGKTYGEMAQNHWEEIDDMVREMGRGMQGTLACALLTHAERRLRGVAEGERWRDKKPSMPDEKRFPFNHGFFRSISRSFTSRNFRSPFPTLDEYLDFAEERGLIDYKVDGQDGGFSF